MSALSNMMSFTSWKRPGSFTMKRIKEFSIVHGLYLNTARASFSSSKPTENIRLPQYLTIASAMDLKSNLIRPAYPCYFSSFTDKTLLETFSFFSFKHCRGEVTSLASASGITITRFKLKLRFSISLLIGESIPSPLGYLVWGGVELFKFSMGEVEYLETIEVLRIRGGKMRLIGMNGEHRKQVRYKK